MEVTRPQGTVTDGPPPYTPGSGQVRGSFGREAQALTAADLETARALPGVLSVTAVSYTHLDVYKRQTSTRRPAPSSRTCSSSCTATTASPFSWSPMTTISPPDAGAGCASPMGT